MALSEAAKGGKVRRVYLYSLALDNAYKQVHPFPMLCGTLGTLPRPRRALEPSKKPMYPASEVNTSTARRIPRRGYVTAAGRPSRVSSTLPPRVVACGTAGIRDVCGTGGGG